MDVDHARQVLKRLAFASICVTLSGALAAQEPRIELQVTGEHRLVNGDTPDSARQFALADARRQAVRAAASALPARLNLTTLKLTPAEIEGLAAAMIDIEELPATGATSPRSTVRVSVRARFESEDPAQRLLQLLKDDLAVRAIVAAWTQSDEAYQRVTEQTRRRPGMSGPEAAATVSEQLRALTALEARRLAARGTAALARTELGTIGGLTPMPDGRRRAREFADRALALAPESPDARTLLGDVFVDAEEVAAAEAEYRRALVGNANSAVLRTKLAEALRYQGKFDEAIAELREAFRVDPTFAQAHSDLGMILRVEGRIAEAEAAYREAIRLDPRSTDAYNGLAITYAGSKRSEEALAAFQAIVAIDPDSPIGYYNMATALANLDRDVEAAAALRQVIRINPNHYNARFNLGELFRLEGKFDDSAAQFTEYLRLAPETPQNRRNIERARRYVQQFTNP